MVVRWVVVSSKKGRGFETTVNHSPQGEGPRADWWKQQRGERGGIQARLATS